MDQELYAITKLANELTDRVEQLENENAMLRTHIVQVKQASLATPRPDEKVVDNTINLMLKSGALNQNQCAEGKKTFMENPTAAHYIIQRLIIDAQAQAKTAAEDNYGNISGGSLVNSRRINTSDDNSDFERLQRILGLI